MCQGLIVILSGIWWCGLIEEGGKIDTKQLKSFLAVYASGSFTKAAKMLNTSQPAVSEQIKSLENNLNCRLFDRMGRSIKPTLKADILYPGARSVIDNLERIKEEISSEDQCVRGELIIGASTIPGAYLLPHFASRFQKQHQSVSFEIRIADSLTIIHLLTEHKILLGVVGAKQPSSRLNFKTIGDDELILVSSTEKIMEKSVDLKDLLRMPFLLREEGSGTRKAIEECGIKNGFTVAELNTVAVLGSNAAIKEAVKEDLGVSIVSRISVRDELVSGRLQETAIEGVRMRRSFYSVTLKGRSLPNLYFIFLKKLLSMG